MNTNFRPKNFKVFQVEESFKKIFQQAVKAFFPKIRGWKWKNLKSKTFFFKKVIPMFVKLFPFRIKTAKYLKAKFLDQWICQ